MARRMPSRNKTAEVAKPKEPEDTSYKEWTLTIFKKEYPKLLKENKKLQECCTCHTCGRLLPRTSFYISNKTGSGVIPTCKECLYLIATRYDKESRTTNESVDTIKAALKIADLPFRKELYESCVTAKQNETADWKAGTVWQHYVTMVQAAAYYRDMGWIDSDFEVVEADKKGETMGAKAKSKSKKLFGEGFKDDQYIFLQDQYDDWTSRYECKSKAQEELFKRICFKQLEILEATRNGGNTKDLDATLQQLMNSANIQPKQNSLDAFSDAQTFGTLIQKWEENDPISEIDPELKDIDKIGLYIDVFFRGHLAKMLNLKNALSALYDKFMEKFTVKKPHYDEDTDEEALFNQIFSPKEADGE